MEFYNDKNMYHNYSTFEIFCLIDFLTIAVMKCLILYVAFYFFQDHFQSKEFTWFLLL